MSSEPENRESGETTEEPESTADLETPGRVVFAFGGLVVMGVGSAAVFRSDNQAGTVALIGIGAICLLIAAIGRLPLRWIVGSAQLDFRTPVRQIVDSLEYLPRQTQIELRNSLDTKSPVSRRLRSEIANVLSFEEEAAAYLERVIAGWDQLTLLGPKPVNWMDDVLPIDLARESADAVIASGGRIGAQYFDQQQFVVVEFKTRLSVNWLERALERHRPALGLLVVVRDWPGDWLDAIVEESDGHLVVLHFERSVQRDIVLRNALAKWFTEVAE